MSHHWFYEIHPVLCLELGTVISSAPKKERGETNMSTMPPSGKCAAPQFCSLYLKINGVDQDQDSEIINPTFWDHFCNALLCLVSHPLINDLPGKFRLLLKEETKEWLTQGF